MNQPSALSAVPAVSDTARVTLRVVDLDDTIKTIQTVIIYRGDSTYEIDVDGRRIGFINKIDHTFRARSVTARSDSSELGHSFLWDKAVALLLYAQGMARNPDA